MILVVAGIPRCGSTMMMRCLHAGGVEPYADNLASYETEKILGLPQDHEWLAEVEGKSVKVLDPHRARLPKGLPVAIVYMKRNPSAQAKSQAKLLRLVGRFEIYDGAFDKLRASIRVDTRKAIKACRLRGPTLVVRFETVLASPVETFERVAEFLAPNGFEIDVLGAASQVVERGPDCYPGLLEVGLTWGGAR